jgi:hypothetical protein
VDTAGEPGLHKKFHIVVTTNANIYQAWQVRVMYYWWGLAEIARHVIQLILNPRCIGSTIITACVSTSAWSVLRTRCSTSYYM